MKSIKGKIMIPFLIMTAMFIGFMSLQIVAVFSNLGKVKEMQNIYFTTTIKSDALKLSVVQVQQWLTDISATRGAKGFDDGYDEAENYAKLVRSLIGELKSIDPSKQQELDDIAKSFETYYETGKRMAAAYIEKGPNGGNTMMSEFDDVAEDINNRVDSFITKASQDITMSISSIETSIWNSVMLAIISVAGALVVCIVANILINRMIIYPIQKVRNAAKDLSQGKLGIHMDFHSSDEMGQLAGDIQVTAKALDEYISDIGRCMEEMEQGNLKVTPLADFKGDFIPLKNSILQFQEKLNIMLIQINRSAEQVSIGSCQVSSGAQSLASGSAEQSSSIEELTSAINIISEHVRHNAETAAAADNKARIVGKESLNSNLNMAQMVEAMNEINQSSGEIGKIIKTIEDIAFQTNILALNAAVEAARAGVAGKGFAVVADEVRNLASKSAEAASGTTALIEHSIQAIENGTEIANTTAESLRSVVDGVQDVVSTISNISAASAEQRESIDEITFGIKQISEVIQTISAIAQESSAASEELSGEAQVLLGQVNQFQLNQ